MKKVAPAPAPLGILRLGKTSDAVNSQSPRNVASYFVKSVLKSAEIKNESEISQKNDITAVQSRRFSVRLYQNTNLL